MRGRFSLGFDGWDLIHLNQKISSKQPIQQQL
jgi:hypothetical protein